MAEGDAPSRNFRSAYYEKLGFPGNEERNILDLLIASSPFDFDKLNDLCERFDLDRQSVEAWKILLGVDCSKSNPSGEYDNVRRVRAEHYQSLKHHLEVLLRHNIVIKDRLKKCSKSEPPSDNHIKKQQENGGYHDQLDNQQPGECNPPTSGDTTDNYRHCDNNAKNDRIIGSSNNNSSSSSHTSRRVGSFSDATSQNNHNHRKLSSSSFSSSNYSLLKDIEVRIVKSITKKQQEDSTDSILKEQTSTNQPNAFVDIIQTNPAKLITLMYLLEAGRLNSSDIESQLDSSECRKLSAIASFFVNVSEDHQEAFFLFRNFTRKLEENEALERNKNSSQKPK